MSTDEKQDIAKIRVYPGADGNFTLYDDDGKTYAYEKGNSRITVLHWNEAAKKFSSTGATQPSQKLVEAMGNRR